MLLWSKRWNVVGGGLGDLVYDGRFWVAVVGAGVNCMCHNVCQYKAQLIAAGLISCRECPARCWVFVDEVVFSSCCKMAYK